MDSRVFTALFLALSSWLCYAQEAIRSEAALGEGVYGALIQAQECLERNDLPCVFPILAAVEARQDLTGYEAWQTLNFRAFTYYLQAEDDLAADAYTRLLSHAGIPQDAAVSIWPLLARLHYRNDRFLEALDAIERAIALSQGPTDSRLMKFRQRVADTMAGVPQISDAEDLSLVVAAEIEQATRAHDCEIALAGLPHFDDFTGESEVVYRRTPGPACEQALSELERRGAPMKIGYFSVWPEPTALPNDQTERQRGLRDLNLILEVIE